jgi:alkylation response protein AidB-like acyl-CoA dehydrogenase
LNYDKNAATAKAAVRDLAPRVRELAPTIEAEGRLPPELVDEMRKAGLFHLMLAPEFGGLGLDPVTAAEVVEEMARADGSAGWCLMIAAQNAGFSDYLPDEDVRTIWGNGGICCGTARPTGRAVWTTDPAPGYVVSGRWPFASGSSHATWFAPECMVYDGDEVRKDANGNDVSRMLFVPRDSVTVHNTWDTLGLRGTASNDFSVENVFVPASRGFQMLVSEPARTWPLHKALPLVFINHGSHAIGVGRGALDSANELARSKIGWGGVPIRETPRIQAAIAEATVLVDSAAHYLYDSSRRLWQVALEGGDDPQLRAQVRLAASHAASASLRAVDLVHGVLATSSVFRKTPLERQFRDMHTAAAHVMIGPLTYEAAGRTILGMDAAFPFF